MIKLQILKELYNFFAGNSKLNLHGNSPVMTAVYELTLLL